MLITEKDISNYFDPNKNGTGYIYLPQGEGYIYLPESDECEGEGIVDTIGNLTTHVLKFIGNNKDAISTVIDGGQKVIETGIKGAKAIKELGEKAKEKIETIDEEAKERIHPPLVKRKKVEFRNLKALPFSKIKSSSEKKGEGFVLE